MASVHAEHLVKEFRARQEVVRALDDVSITVNDGEFAVFVGPSGSGKTTFLRCVAGLEIPSSGKLSIGDRDVTTLHPRERGIAMVFQDYALYPHMTVAENMSFALKNLRFPKAEIEARVATAARMLRIEALLERRPRQLSGGQRQRVALGRAIVRKPHVFLFDEPLSNLDAKLRGEMRVELADLHATLQTTAIYVTHDQVEALTLGQRIWVMKDGLVQQVGNGEELYNEPRNMFVASFIGTGVVNMLPATVVSLDGHVSVAVAGQQVVLPPERQQVALPWLGKDVVLGVRPEHVLLDAGEADPSQGVVRAVVHLVERLGSESLVHWRLGGHPLVSRMAPDVALRPGETCSLRLVLEKSHLFDPATEERIELVRAA
jgi:multiple sugar transport system ATP-binding protein